MKSFLLLLFVPLFTLLLVCSVIGSPSSRKGLREASEIMVKNFK
jgi:hypothetical protein